MHLYGSKNWESLWQKLEQAGNVGINHVINPYLYPSLISYLAEHPKALVVDFGCGTNIMGLELLFGYQQAVEGLRENQSLAVARFNTLLYLGLEGSEKLVTLSNNYLKDIGDPANIASLQKHISHDANLLFDEESIDVCTSRNFLMHLPPDDFVAHMKNVRYILKQKGKYIFATLNPDYEQVKHNHTLNEGVRYDFMHGQNGEYGTFFHYYKSTEFCEKVFRKNFTIESKVACVPKTEKFRETHERYYNSEAPIAFIYTLVKEIR